MGNARRKSIVAKVREEGRQAFRNGRHVQTNPYPNYDSNHQQWLRGYMEAESDSKK